MSKAALEKLYRERYAGFRRALTPVAGSYDAAHDVVQESFARALTNRRQCRDEATIAGWVWRIAWNVALERRSPGHEVPFEEAFVATLVEPADDPELERALTALPPRRRLIFFLRYFADFSYAEIATACEISEGTVAAALARARAELGAAIESRANR
ncbi:MAG TPA: RNA polymerase sigma factor [Gaiellaceae bacterium]